LGKVNKHIRKTASYLLLVGLSLHILVIHGLFKSSVICFEDDGTTSIEYTFDDTTNPAHNNVSSEKHELITDCSGNECEDVSLTGLLDGDDQSLIKKSKNVIEKIQFVDAFSLNSSANDIHPIFNTNLTSNSLTLLTQIKTVSLLI